MDDQTCLTCKFFDRPPHPRLVGNQLIPEGPLEEVHGWCRRFPPIATAHQLAYYASVTAQLAELIEQLTEQNKIGDGGKSLSDIGSAEQEDFLFPLTNKSGWCGEYEEKVARD